MSAPAILNVHTPSSSFSIIHSLTQDTLHTLFDTLSRKPNTSYHGERVGPGWLKYEFNDSIWNLDDGEFYSDYTIFVWRQQQQQQPTTSTLTSSTSIQSVGTSTGSSTATTATPIAHTPTLHLRNPNTPLPSPPEYQNHSFYVFHPRAAHRGSPVPSTRSKKSKASARSKRKDGDGEAADVNNNAPRHKKDFEKFHAENGVRTVMGNIGPVQNVRMLLRAGYRHVYISRKFAIKHGFIPKDAVPGYYGYAGLVNIGTWPITLTPSSSLPTSSNNHNAHALDGHPVESSPQQPQQQRRIPQPTMISVFLAEEPHFDVVLGRSFFEKRQIRTNNTDPTDVVCLDTGEKIECELVILKDGRGEIVTVT